MNFNWKIIWLLQSTAACLASMTRKKCVFVSGFSPPPLVKGKAHTLAGGLQHRKQANNKDNDGLLHIRGVSVPVPVSVSVSPLRAEGNANNSNNDTTKTQAQIITPINVEGVTLKMAFDTGYAVADSSELKSERFTCPESLDLVHKLRRNSDCVLVGKGTVVRDDCTLTVRRVELFDGKKQPVRVVIDSKLQILDDDGDGDGDGDDDELKKEQTEFKMLKDGLETIVYHSCQDNQLSDFHANNQNLQVVNVGVSTSTSTASTNVSMISPKKIIKDLNAKNINHIMVEGGPATAIQFLKEKVVDRAILIRAPVTFIDPVPSGMTDDMLREAGLVRLELEDELMCGDDTVEYWVREGDNWPTPNVADWPN